MWKLTAIAYHYSLFIIYCIFTSETIPMLVLLSWIMWGFPWEIFFILHLLFLIWINTGIPITAIFLLSLKNFMNFKTFRELGDYDAVWIHKLYWLILIVWVKLYMAPLLRKEKKDNYFNILYTSCFPENKYFWNQ